MIARIVWSVCGCINLYCAWLCFKNAHKSIGLVGVILACACFGTAVLLDG